MRSSVFLKMTKLQTPDYSSTNITMQIKPNKKVAIYQQRLTVLDFSQVMD